MNLRELVLILVVGAACATTPTTPTTMPTPRPRLPGGVELAQRVYALPEERAQQLVREALEKRGVELLPTEDPHVLMTPVQRIATKHMSIAPPDDGKRTDLELDWHLLITEERSWMVVFEPINDHATAIRVLRGEKYVWANEAERSTIMLSAVAPIRPDPKVAPVFVRDREKEAVVAAALDGQVAVEVSEAAGASAKETEVAPLADPKAPEATASARAGCKLEERDLASMLLPGHMLLMSDPLGASEPWAVVDEVLCVARARSVPVTLVLSLPHSDQARLNRFLASAGTPSDRQNLLASPFWTRPWQDGRTSLATVDALERVRQRRSEGVPITVLAVDTGLSGNPRQAFIASNILRHRSENPERVLIGLLGSVLTSRRQGADWDLELLPVGARLAAVLPEQTHAFDVAYRAGSHWTCRLGERGRLLCGTWATAPGPAQVSHATTPRPYFRTFDTVSAEGFDGIYFVGGELTASVPAVESLRIDEGTRVLSRPAVPTLNAAELRDTPGQRW